MQETERLFEAARQHIPGGVNSPVRAFRGVGGTPIFMDRASGAYIWDADGQRYIDYIGSWGPMVAGHAHPEVIEAVREACNNGLSFGCPTRLENTMAEKVCELVPSMDMVRMTNSGSEATMSAIRLARGYTGRDRIVKFEGNYHGHGDSLLVKAGSGALTLGQPSSPGVPKELAALTSTLTYNDPDGVRALLRGEGRRGGLHHRGADRRQHELHPAPARLSRDPARGLRPARCGADLRRGDDGLPRRRKLRPGLSGCNPRSDHARQDHWWGHARGGVWRQTRDHGAPLATGPGLPGRHAVREPDRNDRRIENAGDPLAPPVSTTIWRPARRESSRGSRTPRARPAWP